MENDERLVTSSLTRLSKRNSLAIVALAAAVGLLLPIILIVAQSASKSGPLVLLSLAATLAVVALWPAFVSMRLHGGRFDLFHPLFYAAWFFFIPQFVLASFIIVFNGLETSAALLLPDPWTPRVAALGAAILGSIGLTAGYFLPVGRWIGRLLPTFKTLNLSPAQVRLSVVPILSFGLLAWIGAFRSSLFGYQFSLETPILGATFASFARFVVIGQTIIWYSYFRVRRGWRLLALISMSIILVEAVMSGSRGALLSSLLIVIGGYQYAQDHLRVRKLWIWGLLVLLSLFIGMVFGSYFRWIKTEQLGRTTSMTAGDIIAVTSDTLSTIKNQSVPSLVEFAWNRLAERIQGITSLGVILSFADRLKAAEAALGIEQNIFRDFATAFIPRFLWPSKPTVGVSEQIGHLYFNTQYNSPAVTYMGDLYRNFGVWGIIPGMLVLGIVLRSLYVWLIENHTLSPLRVGLFLSLGLIVNYEGLYSTYFPALVRALAVALMVLVLVKISRLFSRKIRRAACASGE